MKQIIAFLCAGLFALTACGSDPATCSIADNGDGTRTIDCPGAGPVRVVGGDNETLCTIGRGEDGGKVISCGDGTIVRIDPDGLIVFPGGGVVGGTARLFGRSDHSGIRVSGVGTEYSTTTDADGAYELTVSAGIREVLFESPGRIPVRVGNVPVINGTWSMEPVELKIARRVGGTSVTTAPSSDAVLVFTGVSGKLGWLELVEFAETDGVFEENVRLGSLVTAEHAFSSDGRFVLYQERTGRDGALQLWDRVERRSITIAEYAVRGQFAPGSAVVIYETEDADGGCELRAWWRATGRRAELGACVTRPGPWTFSEDGGRFLHQDATGSLVLFGIDDGSAHVLAPNADTEQFLPGGRYVVYLARDDVQIGRRDWMLLDGATGVRRNLGQYGFNRVGMVIAPDGETLLFERPALEGYELVAHLVETGLDLVLTSGLDIGGAEFSPEGDRVLWFESTPPASHLTLHVLELASPENRMTYPGGNAVTAGFTIGGDSVFVFETTGATRVWSAVTDMVEELAPRTTFWLLNEDHSRLALGLIDDALLLVDFADGSRHRTAAGEGGYPSRWMPDGSGIVLERYGTTEYELVHWAPPAVQASIGRGISLDFTISEAGTIAVLECPEDCSGRMLLLYDPVSGERDPVDEGVIDLRWENGVLVYRVMRSGASGMDDGFYVMPLP